MPDDRVRTRRDQAVFRLDGDFKSEMGAKSSIAPHAAGGGQHEEGGEEEK